MGITADEKFTKLIDNVANQIVATEHFAGGSLVKTPLMYPSGASVVIQITQHQDKFFVTDMGMGSQEAEMFGAGGMFSRNARVVADQFGISFDNQAFFVAEARKEQLQGAVVVVANCSSEAVTIAAYKASEKKYQDDTDKLYQKLVSTFPKEEVERDADFIGSSAHKWKVGALVRHRKTVILFEPVRKNHTAVVNTAVKFHDIARLDQPPRRIAVVEDKNKMGDYINLLSQAGSVIEMDAPSAILMRIAEAA